MYSPTCLSKKKGRRGEEGTCINQTKAVVYRRNLVPLRGEGTVGKGEFCQEDSFHQPHSYGAVCHSVSRRDRSLWMRKARFTSKGWNLLSVSVCVMEPPSCAACAGVRVKKKKRKNLTERWGERKEDRMLIYANAVTHIWKRLVALVGSWTAAPMWLLEHEGHFQPTDSTCTFLLVMFTALWSLEITG